jgi:hypothetical protein
MSSAFARLFTMRFADDCGGLLHFAFFGSFSN